MSELKIIGPLIHREGTDDRILQLVRGDEVLGELVYWNSTRTVVHIRASSDAVRNLLIQEAKRRGLLHGKDIPDHLQHDKEHL